MTIGEENYAHDLRVAREKHRRQKCLDEAVLSLYPLWRLKMPGTIFCIEDIQARFKRLTEERADVI